MKSILRLIAVFMGLALVCCGPSAWAQFSSGMINGRVVDPSGAVIPGASVKLVEQQTQVQVTTKAGANGDFVFPVVQPGTYSVMADAAGFKQFVKRGLVLTSNERLNAGTLTLPVGSAEQSVEVTAALTPVQTTSAENSGDLDVHQLDNELAQGRDFMALVRTLPGVVGSNGSSSLGRIDDAVRQWTEERIQLGEPGWCERHAAAWAVHGYVTESGCDWRGEGSDSRLPGGVWPGRGRGRDQCGDEERNAAVSQVEHT